jgi:TolB protein
MRKLTLILLSATLCITQNAFALLNLELTRGVSGAVPIAVASFSTQGAPQEDISAIITNDLRNSGRFKVTNPGAEASEHPETFKQSGIDNIVVGKVQELGSGRYQVSFQLLDTFKNKATPEQSLVVGQKFVVSSNQLRSVAHHISDLIYQKIVGVRGVFSTRLAYVLVQRSPGSPTRYILEVSDQDGYNPHTLLTSNDPIMSPAWSPNGRQLAYVSFENRHAAIYIQDLETGSRKLLSEFPGINGAPAWSRDGQKMAIVLSKSGAPNIYSMDLATHQLTQLTHDFYINTEPSWSPDGRSLVFTSNRGSNPQIYQMNLASRTVNRVSYDGNYNARASFTADGNHVVMLNRSSNLFNIGVLDLDNGTFRVLTNSGADSESPSIAPNGSMVLYGTVYHGHSILAMVATDGSVQVRLPARTGDVQDPAWSPYLT